MSTPPDDLDFHAPPTRPEQIAGRKYRLAQTAANDGATACQSCHISPQLFSVKRVRLFKRDAVSVFELHEGVTLPHQKTSPRGSIETFSTRSRFRLLHVAKNSPRDFRSIMTLTYPGNFPCDGKRVRRDRDAFLKSLRRRYPSDGYLWFLEFQARGAPHFHMLHTRDLPEPRVKMKRRPKKGKPVTEYETNLEDHNWLAETWYRIVDSGDKRHLRAGTAWEVVMSEEGAARYAATHAAKPHQRTVPKEYQNVGRFWGHSKDATPECLGEIEIDEEMLRSIFGSRIVAKSGRVNSYLWDTSKDLAEMLWNKSASK